MVRVVALLGGAVLGVVSSVAAVLLHQAWVWLVVALVAAAATMRALGPGAARVGFALGWLVVVLRGALTTPAGDYLVPDNARGWTLLAASLVLVLTSLVTVRPSGGVDGVGGQQPTPT